jgi:hypothetical protein
MPDDTTTALELITAEELTTIYAALEALKAIKDRAADAAYGAPSSSPGIHTVLAGGLGRIAGVADMAADNLHDVLINLHVYGQALTNDADRNYVVAGRPVAGDD